MHSRGLFILTRAGAGMDKSSCRRHRSPDSRPNGSFYSLGTKTCGKETPKGNRNVNDTMTLGWCALGLRGTAHSTVGLVMPWFLGPKYAPPPGAPYRGRGGGQ